MIKSNHLNIFSLFAGFYSISITILLLASSAIGETISSVQEGMVIKVLNGLVTGEIHDQPLVDVITEIGEVAGFSVIVIDETVKFPSVNTHFDQLLVEDAIKRLLDDVNSVIYFIPDNKNSDQRIISQVWLVGLASSPDINDHQYVDQAVSVTPDYAKIKSLNDAVVLQLHEKNSLSKQKKNLVLSGLINVLETAEDPITKARAAISLGNFKDKRSVSVLEQALAIEEPMVRLQIIYALGQIGNNQAAIALGGLLLDPSANLNERIKAAQQLNKMNSETANQYLEMAAKNANNQIRMSVSQETLSIPEKNLIEKTDVDTLGNGQ